MEGASRLAFVGFRLVQSVSDLDRGAGVTPGRRLLLYYFSSVESIRATSDL